MADSIEVRAAAEGDAAAWDRYVFGHSQATFFHRFGWKRVIESTYGYSMPYLLAERAGSPVGVLPLGEVRHPLFGNALISVPFCVYGGVLADDEAARSALEQHAIGLANARAVDHLELRYECRQHDDWPHERDLYVTFKRPLTDDPLQNLQAVPRKQRAMIRKGIAAGLRSEWVDDVAAFYLAYSESVRNLGTPVLPRRHFAAIRQEFGDDVEVLLVHHRNSVIAAVMSYYFRDQVLPYYGGGGVAARRLAANDFMYWSVMQRATERGCRVFDFGRSKVGSGSFRFKQHWGFEAKPLSYEYQLIAARERPQLNPNNPRYRLLIAAWKRLPLAISRGVGPWLARGLA